MSIGTLSGPTTGTVIEVDYKNQTAVVVPDGADESMTVRIIASKPSPASRAEAWLRKVWRRL